MIGTALMVADLSGAGRQWMWPVPLGLAVAFAGAARHRRVEIALGAVICLLGVAALLVA